MFIQTEATPNPATLKFLPGRAVLKGAPLDFPDRAAAERSPLATRLFAIDGVAGVFLGGDFVSVSKDDEAQWYQLKPAVLAEIMDHFTAGDPVVIAEDDTATEAASESGDVGGIAGQIRELLDTRVRPAVAMDGGDITFEGFEDGVVYLHLKGACAGCPSSTATLKSGIENMLRHYIPEVTEVRAV
jgi:Fe-S cluster biogenesis protein NfuA